MANGTLYSQINPVSFSEFTPSRLTRVSSNPFLQEHCPFSKLQNRRKANREERSDALSQRKYAQLEFSEQKTSSIGEPVEDVYSTIRRYKSSHADLGFHLESVIGYTTDFLFGEEEEIEGDSNLSESYPGVGAGHTTRRIITQSPLITNHHDTLMDRPISFALAIGEDPILFDGEASILPNRHDDITSPQRQSVPLYQNVSSSLSPSPVQSEPSEQTTADATVHHRYAVSLSSSPAAQLPSTIPISQLSIRQSHKQQCVASMENILAESNEGIDPPAPVIINRLRCNSSSTPNLLQASSEVDLSSIESYGCYSVCYLGSIDIDSYSNCINDCARKLLDPSCNKVSLILDNVTVDIVSEKVRLLQPKSGALLKSISMHDVFMFSQCTKNKRLIGILVWRKDTRLPICHLFRCSDQHVSNAFMESLSSVKQDIDYKLLEKIHNGGLQNNLSVSLSTSSEFNSDNIHHKLSAVHVATINKIGRTQTVPNIIKRVIKEQSPSQSNTVSVWVSPSQIRLVQTSNKKQLTYGQHDMGTIQAIGVDHNDNRLIGYIIKEKNMAAIAYVIWCYSTVEAENLVTFLQQACQNMYHQQKRHDDWTDGAMIEGNDDDNDDKMINTSSRRSGIFSLFRSMKPAARSSSSIVSTPSPLTSPISCSVSSFQSYLSSSQQISSSTVVDIPQKRKNSVILPKAATSSFETADEDFAKFSVSYVGSANIDEPFNSDCILLALKKFEEGGVAVGMAAIPKNTIIIHISSFGINLTDKKQKLFINRNYPQKQIIGHSVCLVNNDYFGFATVRPGFKDQLKVHVFCQLVEPVQQIIDAMTFWLNLPKQ